MTTQRSSPALSLNAAYHTILATDGGLLVFEECNLPLGRHVSPFRSDAKGKNFSVYRTNDGTICFNDFVSGEGGNFTALLQKSGFHSFHAQIRYAAALYHLTLREDDHQQHTSLPPVANRTKQPQHKKTDQSFYRVLSVETDDFTPDELDVLRRVSGGLITAELVQRFNIRALRSYTDEGRSKRGNTFGSTHTARYTLVAPAADGNWYAYVYFQAAQNSPFPNNAKNFHLKLHEYTAKVKFSLGLTELRTGEPAYIVEGIKDCLMMLALGYNAFTLGGVQHRLPQSVQQQLHDNRNRLAIVFDTDFAGINATERLRASLPASLPVVVCNLPRLERQETREAPKPSLNDIADYITTFGADAELHTALALPMLQERTVLTRAGVSTQAAPLTVHHSLAESPQSLAVLTAALRQHPRLALCAPTGCGKTFTLLKHLAPAWKGRIVFAVPTVALVEQIDREYASTPNNTENPCKIVCVSGKDTALTLLEAHTSAKVIVCTYNMLSTVLTGSKNANLNSVKKSSFASLLDEPDTLLVIDEAHKLHEENSFRTDTMQQVFAAMRRAARVLIMSATPSLLWATNDELPFVQLAVRQTHSPRSVECQPVFYNNKPVAATLSTVLRLREQALRLRGEHGVIVVRLNNIKHLNTLRDALVDAGVPKHHVDIISSLDRPISTAYRQLVEHGVFSTPIVLTTSALDCGVNILNTNITAALMVDETHPHAIEQFANRFRAMSTVPLLLLLPEAQRHRVSKAQLSLPFPFSAREHCTRHLMNAQMRAHLYNHETQTAQQPIRHTSTHGISSRSVFRELNHHVFRISTRFNADNAEYAPYLPAMIADTEYLYYRLHHCMLWEHLGAAGMSVREACTLDEYATLLAQTIVYNDETPPSDTQKQPINNEHINDERIDDNHIEELCAQQTARHTARTHEERRQLFSMLAENPALLLETLWHITFNAVLKRRIGRLFPVAPTQSAASKTLLLKFPFLRHSSLPERLATRYLELRSLHFTHTEAVHLLEHFFDDRRWKTMMDNLAMHHRLTLEAMSNTLTDRQPYTILLSLTDRDKLSREKEIRAMVTSAALMGCTVRGSITRHIHAAIANKTTLTERVNAFRNRENRLTKQQAGMMVNALFFCSYKRERAADGKTFTGYYAFETEEHDAQSLRRRTLADYADMLGLNGADYAARWEAAIRAVVKQEYGTHSGIHDNVQEVEYSIL